MALVWRGEELKRRLEKAQRDAINELAQEAATDLRRSVPVQSGKLKRSVRVAKARRTKNGKGYEGGGKLARYSRLGRNRRMVGGIERDALGKLGERIATKFRRGV